MPFVMKLLRRKIDEYLKAWKDNKDRMPLVVKGARQVGKTASILQFAHDNYKNVEVKTTDSATKSLTKLTAQDGKYPDIRYGIKLCNKNIGFNGKLYTFPYFLTFLLKRFVRRDL